MRAYYFEQPGCSYLAECHEPQITDDLSVKVSIDLVGLCGTDAHIIALPQKHPAQNGIILGHEFVGHIVEVGKEVKEFKIGDRVIAGPNIPCLHCKVCQSGQIKFCENNKALGITINGGLAEFVVAPARAFYKIPSTLSNELAIFAEPLSCVLNGLFKLGHIQGEKIVILGCGPIGQYFSQLCLFFGAQSVEVVDPVDTRSELAKTLGAHGTIPSQMLEEHFSKFGIAIDTTGFLITESVRLIKPGGKSLIFGLDQTCRCQVQPFELARWEKSVFGCFIENSLIPKCLDLIGKLNFYPLITHKFCLEQIDQALLCVANGTSIKVLVYPKGVPSET